MGTKVNSNYESLLTFTRASKGHALRPVSYGDELVTNGDFSSTDLSDWIELGNPTATVSGGELTLAGDGGYDDYIQQEVGLTAGKIYTVQCTARRIVGSVRILVRYASSPYSTIEAKTFSSSSNETFTVAFVAPTNAINIQLVQWSGSTGSGVFDNVSVKEVTFDQPDGTLTLFEHPDNVPRVEWDADRNRLGLLVEEPRTNLVTQSNLSNWLTTAGASINTNYANSPENIQNATALIASSSDCRAYVAKTLSGSGHTFSVYAKEGANRYLMLRLNASGGQYRRYFDLQGGVLASETGSGSASIQEVNGGWYRCSITTADTLTSSQNVLLASTNQDGTESGSVTSGVGVYLFGAQVETGSFPTSYIKNEGTASGVTRSADVASIPVADFGYNQSEGTLYAEFDVNTLSDQINGGVVVLIADAGDNRIRINTVSDNIRGQIRKDASNSFSVSVSGYGSSTGEKVALAFKENDAAFVISGATLDTDSSVAIPRIETLQVAGNSFCGHLKSTKYYPRRLTNAQLQDLTS